MPVHASNQGRGHNISSTVCASALRLIDVVSVPQNQILSLIKLGLILLGLGSMCKCVQYSCGPRDLSHVCGAF